MQLTATLLMDSKLKAQLKKVLTELGDFRFLPVSQLGQFVFMDAEHANVIKKTASFSGKAVFLVVPESISASKFQSLMAKTHADDGLAYPFRAIDVLSKIRQYDAIVMRQEIQTVSQSVSELVARFQEDLKLAESLQKKRHPSRNFKFKGFKLRSRLIAGVRPGGDYFDVAESRDKKTLSILMTQSNSYSLSSSILSILMRALAKLSIGPGTSCQQVIRAVYEELGPALNEQDELSIFFGVLSRSNLTLSYVQLGESMVFHVPVHGQMATLESQGKALRKGSFPKQFYDSAVVLRPQDRLVFLSQGLVQASGGERKLNSFMKASGTESATNLLNEFAFRIKNREGVQPSIEDEVFPDQDCTAAILDIENNVIRLEPKAS